MKDFFAIFQLILSSASALFFSKMGPRRKLQMAIKEMKEHLKVNESAGSSMGRSQDITPTPQHSIEKDLQMQIMQLKATNQQVEREGGKRGWEEREGEEESIIKF